MRSLPIGIARWIFLDYYVAKGSKRHLNLEIKSDGKSQENAVISDFGY